MGDRCSTACNEYDPGMQPGVNENGWAIKDLGACEKDMYKSCASLKTQLSTKVAVKAEALANWGKAREVVRKAQLSRGFSGPPTNLPTRPAPETNARAKRGGREIVCHCTGSLSAHVSRRDSLPSNNMHAAAPYKR